MKMTLIAFCALGAALAQTPPPKYPNYPSETPAEFKPVTDTFDYTRREAMIAMRDGVKLFTVILDDHGLQMHARQPCYASLCAGHSSKVVTRQRRSLRERWGRICGTSNIL